MNQRSETISALYIYLYSVGAKVVQRIFGFFVTLSYLFVPTRICHNTITDSEMVSLLNRRRFMAMRHKLIDDGYAPELVEGAAFDGELEIPIIHREELISPPFLLRPFSRRGVTAMPDEYICYYEHDVRFAKLIENACAHLDSIRKFKGMVSPDCSLYRDMPLVLQIANTYLNRAVGHYFQSHGVQVIPNVRWGDERSYHGTQHIEPFAFLGIEKHSVVSIGTYGCIRGDENRFYFREGLTEMLRVIEPPQVLVYGNMPSDIFGDCLEDAEFVRYDDWTRIKKGVR